MRSVDCGNNHPMGVPFLDGEQPLVTIRLAKQNTTRRLG